MGLLQNYKSAKLKKFYVSGSTDYAVHISMRAVLCVSKTLLSLINKRA